MLNCVLRNTAAGSASEFFRLAIHGDSMSAYVGVGGLQAQAGEQEKEPPGATARGSHLHAPTPSMRERLDRIEYLKDQLRGRMRRIMPHGNLGLSVLSVRKIPDKICVFRA